MEEQVINEEETIKKIKLKAEFFKENDYPIHITLKNFRMIGERKELRFHNGKIIKLSKQFIVLDDIKNGATPIFWSDIWEIERYRTLEEKEG